MALGVRGTEAARFSFLLSIPAILGAGVLKVIQAFSTGNIPAGEWAGLLLGALTAGAVGALAIKGLLVVIARGRLTVEGFRDLLPRRGRERSHLLFRLARLRKFVALRRFEWVDASFRSCSS
jgi:hypothetical protein